MSKLDLYNNPVIQSSYTRLEAVGSNGSDKTVNGHHLRWDFRKSLGNNHIARGALNEEYPSIIPLEENDQDYVHIYRTLFSKKYHVTVNFQNSPDEEITDGGTREWKYNLPVNGLEETFRNVTLRFKNVSVYDQIREGMEEFDTSSFLSQYPGLVEVFFDSGELFFYYEFDSTYQSGGVIRIESISLTDSSDNKSKIISSRKKINNNNNPVHSDNLQSLRFDMSAVNIQLLHLIVYADFMVGINNENDEGTWESVGQFGLTLDTDEAGNRLMGSFIDHYWPKYTVAGIDEFKVKSSNYSHRWEMENGIRSLVQDYIQLSEDDTKAVKSFPSDTEGDSFVQEMSCLNLLQLLSLDYHVARMLGLGHIVTIEEGEEKYVYCMQYKTYCDLEGDITNPEEEKTHLFMSLPTSNDDSRLPHKPVLDNPTFGVTVDNGTSKPSLLTDADGYAKFGHLRFININRLQNVYENGLLPFFSEQKEFNLGEQTQPIAYGLKYKRDGETTYHKPELKHDKTYKDHAGISETLPILNTGLTIFTHQESEEGTHQYASYSINWFSRVSGLTSEISVTTSFPTQSHLLPPFNFATQLIQDEDPAETNIADKVLVLTTQAEQTLLSAHNSSHNDSTFVRVTFDWNHIHHDAHQFADYAEFLFRKNEPLVVKGKVLAVTDMPDNQAKITTTTYHLNSMSVPAEVVQPVISNTDKEKFIGSIFSCANNNYIITDILSTGNNPEILVKKIKDVKSEEIEKNTNKFSTYEEVGAPETGELFFIIENTGNVSNWDLRHTRKIYLEKFYTNSRIGLRYSSSRVEYYNIDSIDTSSGNTAVIVDKKIEVNSVAGLNVEYYVKHSIDSLTSNQIIIQGDFTSDFTANTKFRIFGSPGNDNEYTVGSANFSSNQTTITLAAGESFPDTSITNGLVHIKISRQLQSIDQINNAFVLSGNKSAELDIAHVEYKTESDGSKTRFVVGGITDTVTFSKVLDAENNETGYLEVIFDNFNLQNKPHPDADISWDKGIIRLTDIDGNTRPYNVSFIGNKLGNQTNPTTVIIQDPDFIPDAGSGSVYSLDVNAGNTANFHPSYKIYITSDDGVDENGNPIPVNNTHFNEEAILPAPNDYSEMARKTYLGIRALDVKEDYASFISPPSVLMAQRITIPKAPAMPVGPKYATRPDFYGKSTYTFDVKVDTTNRAPYAVVFYRGSDDLILKTLYKKSTVEQIRADLDNLPYSDAKYDADLWKILLTADYSGNAFKTRTTTEYSYTWPNPDNEEYAIPFETNREITPDNYDTIMPEGCTFPFTDSFSFSGTYDGMTGAEVVKKAILKAFTPLNENPPVYAHIKTGKQTSSEKSIFRDKNGNLLNPDTHDLYPMVKKFEDTSGNFFLRFTDYTLDGASTSMYFYLAIELSDKFRFSQSSPPVGPVLMVNSAAVEKPQIRNAVTILPDAFENTDAAIKFEINKYLPIENITKIKLYRAISDTDALSVRTMSHIKTFELNEEVIDDFASDPSPLYGEDLYYRIVAVKEIDEIIDVINNPQTHKVEIESMPSEVFKLTLADSINPEPPELSSTNSSTNADNLTEVILKWQATCYNGKYRLQKLNSNGNWDDIYSISKKSGSMQYPPLDGNQNPDFTNYSETALLPRKDSNGNPLFHRYRVIVENSSGLFNIGNDELTIATGANDLARIDDFLSFRDASHELDVLFNKAFDEGNCHPEFMKFGFLPFELPAGHHNISNIEITVEDDLGNTATKSIANPAFNDELEFNSDDGLQMGNRNPSRIYKVITKIQTDFVDIDGNSVDPFEQVFILDYLSGRYNDLWLQRMDMSPAVIGAAVAAREDCLYIIGGNDGSTNSVAVTEYNISTNQIIEKEPWEERNDALAIESEGLIFLIGGYIDDPQNMINKLLVYNPDEDIWDQVSETPFETRINAVFVSFQGLFFYGLGEDGNGEVSREWWMFDLSSGDWVRQADIPVQVTRASWFILHEEIYILGGFNGDEPVFDCWKYSINDGTWQEVAPLPNPTTNEAGLFNSVGFANNDCGFVSCGAYNDNEFSKTIWKYCPDKDEWCKVSDFKGSAVTRSIAVMIEGKAYIAGGYNEDGSISSEIWEFLPL